MTDVLKCLILAIVVLAPMWIFSNELSGDEFVKSAAGLAAGAIMLTSLRLLETQFTKGKK